MAKYDWVSASKKYADKRKKEVEENKKISGLYKVDTDSDGGNKWVRKAVTERDDYDDSFVWTSDYKKTAEKKAKEKTSSGVDISSRLSDYSNNFTELQTDIKNYADSGYNVSGDYLRSQISDLRQEAKELLNIAKNSDNNVPNEVIEVLENNIKILKSQGKGIVSKRNYVNQFKDDENYKDDNARSKAYDKAQREAQYYQKYKDYSYKQIQNAISQLKENEGSIEAVKNPYYGEEAEFLKNYAVNYQYKNEKYTNKVFKQYDDEMYELQQKANNTTIDEIKNSLVTDSDFKDYITRASSEDYYKELVDDESGAYDDEKERFFYDYISEKRGEINSKKKALQKKIRNYKDYSDKINSFAEQTSDFEILDEKAINNIVEDYQKKYGGRNGTDNIDTENEDFKKFMEAYYPKINYSSGANDELLNYWNEFLDSYNVESIPDYFTDEEKSIYANFIKKANESESAQDKKKYIDLAREYYSTVNSTFDANERKLAQAVKQTEDASLLEKIGANILSVPANVLGGVAGTIGDVVNIVSGEELNPYDDWHGLTNYATTVRQGTANSIDSSLGKFIYNTGMGMADFVTELLVSKGLTKMANGSDKMLSNTLQGIVSAGAYNSTVTEAKRNGASDVQAITLGVSAGVIEALTEKYSIDALLKVKPGDKLLSTIAKNFVTEGSEEVASELANFVVNLAVMSDESDFKKAVDNYIDYGYTEKEAKTLAYKDLGKQCAESFASGGIMGGVLGGVTGIATNKSNNNILSTEESKAYGQIAILTDNAENIIDTAKEYNINTNKAEKSLTELEALEQELENDNSEETMTRWQKKFAETADNLSELELYIEQSGGEVSLSEDHALQNQSNDLDTEIEKQLEISDTAKELEAELHDKGLSNQDKIVNRFKAKEISKEVSNLHDGKIEVEGVIRSDKVSQKIKAFNESRGYETVWFKNAKVKSEKGKLQSVKINGFTEGKKIYLNTDVPLERQIFKHEYHHTLETSKGYETYTKRLENSTAFQEWIKAKAKELNANGDYESQYAKVLNSYRRKQSKVKSLSNTQLKNEAYADFMAEVLFGGKDFNKAISELEKAFESKSAFRKFIDGIKEILAKIKEAFGYSASIKALERNIVKLQQEIDNGSVEKTSNDKTISFSAMNNKSFENNVDDIVNMSEQEALKNKREANFVKVIDSTPDVILDNVEGAENIPVIIRFDALYLATRENGVLDGHYHKLGEQIKNLPQYISEPDTIVRMKNGRINLFATMESKKGNNGIISIELNTVKDINSKYDKYNLVISVFTSKDNYIKNLIEKQVEKIEYKKENLSQVNPQLYKWLAIINDKSSDINVSQDETFVNSIISEKSKKDTKGKELESIISRLNNNESVSIEEINANEQIKRARAKADSIPATNTINTPQRKKLRQSITEKLLENGSYNGVDENGKEVYNGNIKTERRIDLVIGVPAAGKSSVLVNPLSEQYQSRVVDSDMAKELLPEFNNGLGANAVHKESQNIIVDVIDTATQKGENIVHPIVGGKLDSLISTINYFKDNGYSVYLHLNELPINKSVGRAINRFIETGRFIPPEILFDYQDKPTLNFNQLKEREDLIDGYSLYSNDVRKGQSPKLIEASEGVQLLLGRGRNTSEIAIQENERKNKSEAELENSAFSNGEVKFAIEDDIVDRYTEKQYNNFGWVRANNVLTPAEYQHFNTSFSDNKNLGFKFTRNSNTGETIIPTGDNANKLNVLVYTKGTFNKPIITKVIRINTNDTTDIAMIRSDILDSEARGNTKPYGFIETYFGKILLETKRTDLPSLREIQRERKGSVSRENFKDSRESGNRTRGNETNTTDSKAGLDNNSAFSVDEKFDELNEKYGTIEKGVNAERDIDVPKQTSDEKITPFTVRSILEKGNIDGLSLEWIKQDVVDEAMSFKPETDEKALAYAQAQLESGQGEAMWNKAVESSKVTKGDIAIGSALLEMYANSTELREVEKADKILNLTAELCEVGTRAGQVVQSFSLLKKMGGVGRLYYLQKSVNTLNRDLQKKYKGEYSVKINEEQALFLANAKTEAEITEASQKLMKSIAKQLPSNFIDKWNAWRYLSMLGNTRTHIRNIFGNAVFYPAVKIKDGFATVMERAFIKDKSKRTKAFTFTISKEIKEFAKQDYKTMESYISSSGKYNDNSEIQNAKSVFKFKPLEAYRNFNFNALEKEDALFLRPHYVRAMGEILTARKIDINHITKKELKAVREYACQEAWKATYRDASAVADAISRIAQSNIGTKILVEGIMPFKKTPINILKRGIEYSPIGLLNTIGKGLTNLAKGKFTASEFIDGLASGLTGTGLMALGMLLSSFGIAVGGFGNDDDAWFRKQNGEQEYSIQIGGVSYTVDWMAPVCIPFFIGVELQKILSKENDNYMTAFINALDATLEPITNLSMLQGINDTLNTIKWEDNPAGSVVYNLVESYFMQALPTLAGQITRSADEYRRQNYVDKNSAIPEFLQKAMNTASAKLLNFNGRNKYVDAWGNYDVTKSVWARMAMNMVSPGYYSEVNYDGVNSEIQRLYNAKGNKLVLPDTVAKQITVDGETKYLTADEYEKYQIEAGNNAYKYIDELIKTSTYKNADDDVKVEMITDIYSYCDNKAKTTVSEYELSDSDNKLNMYLERGISLDEYFAEKYKNYGDEDDNDIKLDQDRVDDITDDIERTSYYKNASVSEKISTIDSIVKYVKNSQNGKQTKKESFIEQAEKNGENISGLIIANQAQSTKSTKAKKLKAISNSSADNESKYISMAYEYLSGRKITYDGQETYFSDLTVAQKYKYITSNRSSIKAGLVSDYGIKGLS